MSDVHHPALAHHFDSLDQQQQAASLGMWVFLVTEVMFFGGLFMAYVLYRSLYPEAYAELAGLFRAYRKVGYKNICKLLLGESTPEKLKGET